MLASNLLKLKHSLITVEKWLTSISLLLLLIFSLIQIIARNFFDTGFPTLEIISRHLVLFITFMGAALISEHNNHIKIDILAALLSPMQREKLVRPLLFFCATVCMVYAWYSVQFWMSEWQYAPDHEKWSIAFTLILPAGFILLGIHLLLIAITNFEHDQQEISS